MSDIDAFMSHLGELSKLIDERDKARAAARARKADTLAEAIGNAIEADGQARVFGNAESLARLSTLAAVPQVLLIEEPHAPPDHVYVMREPSEPLSFMRDVPISPPEPPQLLWFSKPTLDMDYHRPVLFMGVDFAYVPKPRQLSRREQHRLEVRAGLAARRERMRRRA